MTLSCNNVTNTLPQNYCYTFQAAGCTQLAANQGLDNVPTPSPRKRFNNSYRPGSLPNPQFRSVCATHSILRGAHFSSYPTNGGPGGPYLEFAAIANSYANSLTVRKTPSGAWGPETPQKEKLSGVCPMNGLVSMNLASCIEAASCTRYNPLVLSSFHDPPPPKI